MQTVYIIISVLGTLVTTLIPSIIAYVKAIRDKVRAQTTAEAEHAQNAIIAEAKRLVESAEVSLEAIDNILKTNNSGTAGGMKKRDVILALKVFCLEHGYAWDDEEMNAIVEREIAFTNAVNAK